ncbi:MAG: hypothetical protein VST69_06880, partial [Nitrospirota bacterium]|nr:hypothetical protein [Nitrospirota bacterium]
MRKIWTFISDPNHQKTLKFVCGGVGILVAGLWTAYLHLSKKPSSISPAPTIAVPNNVISAGGNITAKAEPGGTAIISTGPVTFGISLEQHEARIKHKEEEIRSIHEEREELKKELQNGTKKENTIKDIERKIRILETALARKKKAIPYYRLG